MSTGETSGLAFADAHASKAMAFRREKAREAVLDIAPRRDGLGAAGCRTDTIAGPRRCIGQCTADNFRPRQITASGDVAIFNAGVTIQGRTTGDALSASSAAMAKGITELRGAAIAERDIQTSNLMVEPI